MPNQIRAWLPPNCFVVFVRDNVLGLWVLPVEWEGGCFVRPKF